MGEEAEEEASMETGGVCDNKSILDDILLANAMVENETQERDVDVDDESTGQVHERDEEDLLACCIDFCMVEFPWVSQKQYCEPISDSTTVQENSIAIDQWTAPDRLCEMLEESITLYQELCNPAESVLQGELMRSPVLWMNKGSAQHKAIGNNLSVVIVEPISDPQSKEADVGLPPAPPENKTSSDDVHRLNFALRSAGASVLASNAESKGAKNALNEDTDKYYLSPCDADKFLVVSLSEDILVEQFVIANYERYSSFLHELQVFVSANYPVEQQTDWTLLGTFAAKHVYGEQLFVIPKERQFLVRYVMLKLLSHHGSEFYCTLSVLKVYGKTQLDLLTTVDESSDSKAKGEPNVKEQEELSSSVSLEDRAEHGNESIVPEKAEELMRGTCIKQSIIVENSSSALVSEMLLVHCLSPIAEHANASWMVPLEKDVVALNLENVSAAIPTIEPPIHADLKLSWLQTEQQKLILVQGLFPVNGNDTGLHGISSQNSVSFSLEASDEVVPLSMSFALFDDELLLCVSPKGSLYTSFLCGASSSMNDSEITLAMTLLSTETIWYHDVQQNTTANQDSKQTSPLSAQECSSETLDQKMQSLSLKYETMQDSMSHLKSSLFDLKAEHLVLPVVLKETVMLVSQLAEAFKVDLMRRTNQDNVTQNLTEHWLVTIQTQLDLLTGSIEGLLGDTKTTHSIMKELHQQKDEAVFTIQRLSRICAIIIIGNVLLVCLVCVLILKRK